MAKELELSLNAIVGKLHDAAKANADKVTSSWKSKLKNMFSFGEGDIIDNTGIQEGAGPGGSSLFRGPGEYFIDFVRGGFFGKDKFKTYMAEYMKWFAGIENFDVEDYAVKTTKGKDSTRKFKLFYKVNAKNLPEKRKEVQISKEYEKNGGEMEIDTADDSGKTPSSDEKAPETTTSATSTSSTPSKKTTAKKPSSKVKFESLDNNVQITHSNNPWINQYPFATNNSTPISESTSETLVKQISNNKIDDAKKTLSEMVNQKLNKRTQSILDA